MRSANMFLGALGVERAVMQDCVFGLSRQSRGYEHRRCTERKTETA